MWRWASGSLPCSAAHAGIPGQRSETPQHLAHRFPNLDLEIFFATEVFWDYFALDCLATTKVQFLLSILLSFCLGLEFTGAPGQWARYVRWDASTRSDLSFQFKTDVSDAMILYFDDGGYCDFLQLMIIEGKLQLRFSIDCAETVVTSDKRVNDSNWHFTTLSRYNLRTALRLDSEIKADEVKPQRQFMKIVSDLFLGGVPLDIRTSALTQPRVKEQPPFKGIITDLKYGNTEPRLINSHRVRLDMEGLCAESPCVNGGICSIADGELLCDCSNTGYIGRFCEKGEFR
ncbi:hypothetical protein Z043_104107 [Scleropages formosus]|uniref:Uncharacterized protein n=1 Tax=Scleropages formosus TaxID=113540 RepID=A0A0P7XIM8_SCLFO|nr:hypothetical protein Z043_104107 [Scleropages formosus]